MELLLERKYYKKDYIIGRLYVDYKYFCDTLEPPYGALTSEMTGRQITIVKLCSGKLAIPTGSYRVIVNMSPRFKKAAASAPRHPRLQRHPHPPWQHGEGHRRLHPRGLEPPQRHGHQLPLRRHPPHGPLRGGREKGQEGVDNHLVTMIRLLGALASEKVSALFSLFFCSAPINLSYSNIISQTHGQVCLVD